jgi:hypothetical protein
MDGPQSGPAEAYARLAALNPLSPTFCKPKPSTAAAAPAPAPAKAAAPSPALAKAAASSNAPVTAPSSGATASSSVELTITRAPGGGVLLDISQAAGAPAAPAPAAKPAKAAKAAKPAAAPAAPAPAAKPTAKPAATDAVAKSSAPAEGGGMEAAVLAALTADGSVADSLPFAAAHGFVHAELIGVCKSLASNAFIVTTDLSRSIVQLSKEGVEAAEKGSPEVRVHTMAPRAAALLPRCVLPPPLAACRAPPPARRDRS